MDILHLSPSTRLCAGKNRALDEEELEFLDGVYGREQEIEQAKRKEDEQELDVFRLVGPSKCSAA